MTHKSQASGSSGHNDGSFSNFNIYDGGNYGGDIPLMGAKQVYKLV